MSLLKNWTVWLFTGGALPLAFIHATPIQAEEVTLLPSNPNLDWRLEVERRNCHTEICNLLDSILVTQAETNPTVCGLTQGSRGFALPEWHPQDYRNHLTEIRDSISASYGARTNPPQRHDYSTARILREQFWNAHSPEILSLFQSGIAVFETSLFDIDNDGRDDPIYRLTSIFPERRLGIVPEAGTPWHPLRCSDDENDAVRHVYLNPSARQYMSAHHYEPVAEYLQVVSNLEPISYEGVTFLLSRRNKFARLTEIRSGAGDVPSIAIIWQAAIEQGRE